MTLVAGFSGRGGLVLFADSQETRQGYAKKSVDKLEFWQPSTQDFCLVAGGAGNADHVDKLIKKIGNVVMECLDSDFDALVKTIEGIVAQFFTQQVWSRAADKPEFELLFAIHSNRGFCEQFHVADGLVNHVAGGFKSIGVGSYLAEFLLPKFGESGQEEPEMIATAVHVLKEVKANIDGCGLKSSIWLLRRDGTREFFEQEDLAELENLIERFDDVIRVAFGASFNTTDGRFEPDNIAEELNEIRQEYTLWLSSLHQRRKERFDEYIGRTARLRGA